MDTPERLSIARRDLEAAATGAPALIPTAAVEPLWRFLAERAGAATALPAMPDERPRHDAPRFSFTHLLYYFGGALAIGAATLFMTEAWSRIGPWAVAAIATAYAAAAVFASRALDRRGHEIPAGIAATLAVCLVPLVVWAVQNGLGLWPESPDGGPDRYAAYHTLIDWRWVTLEFATLAAAAVALWALRYPFLMMPVAFTLWYLSMDLARLVVAPGEAESWTFYRDFSMLFGLVMALLAFWIDVRSRMPAPGRAPADPAHPAGRDGGRDYAFWLYLLGVLTFWCALSARPSAGELAKALYALLNVGMVFAGVLLGRRVFTVCGGFGVAFYLGHLAFKVFKDSLLFPVALTAIGIGIVALGLLWQRHEARLRAALVARLPSALRGFAVPN